METGASLRFFTVTGRQYTFPTLSLCDTTSTCGSMPISHSCPVPFSCTVDISYSWYRYPEAPKSRPPSPSSMAHGRFGTSSLATPS
eukprot:762640-Hanusia_phi.AAC.2